MSEFEIVSVLFWFDTRIGVRHAARRLYCRAVVFRDCLSPRMSAATCRIFAPYPRLDCGLPIREFRFAFFFRVEVIEYRIGPFRYWRGRIWRKVVEFAGLSEWRQHQIPAHKRERGSVARVHSLHVLAERRAKIETRGDQRYVRAESSAYRSRPFGAKSAECLDFPRSGSLFRQYRVTADMSKKKNGPAVTPLARADW